MRRCKGCDDLHEEREFIHRKDVDGVLHEQVTDYCPTCREYCPICEDWICGEPEVEINGKRVHRDCCEG